MNLFELKRHLQEHFTDGLVLVIGSGLSVAEGLPGMGALARHLLANVPQLLQDPTSQPWSTIAADLTKGTDLETALLNTAPDESVEAAIMKMTGELIHDAEQKTVQEVLDGARTQQSVAVSRSTVSLRATTLQD